MKKENIIVVQLISRNFVNSFLFKCIATLIFCISHSAFAALDIPELKEPIIDNGAFFTPASKTEASQTLYQLYQRGGPQLVVWTFPSLEGEDIAQVGIRAADKWKVGRAGQDDGLILLIARNERMVRLEVGRGLEGTIPDILSDRLIQKIIRPALVQNTLGTGVIELAKAVEALESNPSAIQNLEDDNTEETDLPRWFYVLLFIVFIFMSVFGRRGPPRNRGRGGFGGFGGFGGMGRGGRGGGWSGGGGGFGGGGSSSKW